MNNSYFVCDVAPMKLCYPHAQQSIVCVLCTHLLLHNNVEKKLHKNFMPLLTHKNACIIYTEVTWRLLFTLDCSWVARHPFSLVYKSAGTISWISQWIFQWVFVGNQCRAGNLKKSKKRGLIFSVKLQQNYKEKNMTTTINCYLNTT